MSEMNLEQFLSRKRSAEKEIVNVDEPQVQLVIFSVGRNNFAFYGSCVREIIAHADIFFLPCCPPSLEGVINVRGDIESVMRLDDLLNIQYDADTQMILLGKTDTLTSGIRVDRVLDVIEIPRSSIQLPPLDLPESLRVYVKGVFPLQESPVTLLDMELIFAEYAAGRG